MKKISALYVITLLYIPHTARAQSQLLTNEYLIETISQNIKNFELTDVDDDLDLDVLVLNGQKLGSNLTVKWYENTVTGFVPGYLDSLSLSETLADATLDFHQVGGMLNFYNTGFNHLYHYKQSSPNVFEEQVLFASNAESPDYHIYRMADFNGDELVDYAVFFMPQLTPTIYINQGSNDYLEVNITEPLSLSNNAQYHHVKVIDMNLDGYDDLVYLANDNQEKLIFLRSNGDDSFTRVDLGSNDFFAINSVSNEPFTYDDFDNNGLIDILLPGAINTQQAPFNRQIKWIKQTADSVFTSQQIDTGTDNNSRTILATDLNGDMRKELVTVPNNAPGTVNLHEDLAGNFNNTTGLFETTNTSFKTAALHDSQSATTRLINLEFTGYHPSPGFSLFTYQATDYLKSTLSDELVLPFTFKTIDLDQQYPLEVLVGGGASRKLWLYQQRSDFSFSKTLLDTQSSPINNVTVLDINADGFDDIITLNNNTMVQYLNDTNGGFLPQQQVDLPAGSMENSKLIINDIDQDGDLDLFRISTSSQSLSWYQNINNSFAEGVSIDFLPGSSGNRPYQVADMDGDGDTDLVASVTSCVIFVCENFTAIYYFEQTTQSFGDRTIITEERFNTMRVADFNGDGQLDIYVRDDDQNSYIYQRSNDQYLPSPFAYPFSRSTQFKDFNGDGLVDYFEAFSGQVWHNQGNFSFYSAYSIPAEARYSVLLTDNINGDDLLDFIELDFVTSELTLHTSTGTFTEDLIFSDGFEN